MQTVRVNYLRVYPEVRNEKTKNGTSTLKAGAVVLVEPFEGTKVITLSPKQLDNLTSLHNIQAGSRGWKQLSALIGTGGKASVMIDVIEHKIGDEYTDAAGEVKKQTANWKQPQISCFVLSDKVEDYMKRTVTESIVAGWDNFLGFDDPFEAKAATTEVPE